MKAKKGRLKVNRMKRDSRGFTLAELLLVVGIILILAGVSFVAASYYFKVLKLNAMDNTAKQIFIAAQNHLTSADTSGELERYADENSGAHNNGADNLELITGDDDETGLGKLMDYKPSDVNETDIEWPKPTSSNDEFYYIRHENDESEDNILQYVLPAGAIDDNVNTEGKYIIEYNVKTASVYGVFYTEAKNTLTRDIIVNDFNNESPNNGRGGDDAAKKVRRNHKGPSGSEIIGYYGGAMADEWRKAEAPLQLKVKNGSEEVKDWETDHEYNEEQLIAIIRDTQGQNTKKIVLQVHGLTSGNYALVSCNVNKNILDSPSEGGTNLTYNVDCGKDSVKTTFGKAYKIDDDCNEYQIVLDDIISRGTTDKNYHFAYLFPTMLPGEDIELTAYSYDSEMGISYSGKSNLVTENSLFAKAYSANTGYANEKMAEISSFRHLENIDNTISGIQRMGNVYSYKNKYVLQGEDSLKFKENQKGERASVDFVFVNYKQTADLNWSSYYGKDENNKTLIGVSKTNSTETVATKTLYVGGNRGNAVYPGTFYSINKCDVLDYDGNDKKISDVKILNNVTVNDSTTNGFSNGGIFGYINWYAGNRGSYNFGTRNCNIHDLTISNIDVKAPKNAAALSAESKNSGYNELHINNVLVAGGSIKSGYYYSTENDRHDNGDIRGNAGGLAGYVGNVISVDRCASSAVLESTGLGYDLEISGFSIHLNATDTGGLVGEIRGAGRFTNSYTGGTTDTDGNYATTVNEKTVNPNIIGTYTAGGLLGRSSGEGAVTISNCYSTCSVYSELTVLDGLELFEHKVNGYAGGLVGYKEKGTAYINSSYATGEITRTDGNSYWDTRRGTIIGGGSASYSGCYYLHYSDSGINQGIFARGGDSGNPSGVAELSYASMAARANGQKNETQRNNRSGSFPFVAVNSTGLQKPAEYSRVHYGDWPKWQNPIVNEADILLGYKEISYQVEDGNRVENTHWYVVSKDNSGKCTVALNDLPSDNSNYLNDNVEGTKMWSYGILTPNNVNLNSYFQENTNDNNIISRSGEEYNKKDSDVEIAGKTYTYWELEENEDYDDIITTPKQNNNKGNANSQFKFNRKFAAAITGTGTYASNLGTASNMYQIRSEEQLENINSGDGIYLGKQFHQTLNIDMTGDGNVDSFQAIGSRTSNSSAGFTGVYSGEVEHPYLDDDQAVTSYKIENFTQMVTSGEDTGLFGKIGSNGTVKNVDLIGRSVEENNNNPDIDIRAVNIINTSVDIGGFAAYNAGTVTNCSANLIISTEKADEGNITLPNGLVSAGGMFGSSNNDSGASDISNCQFRGKLILNKFTCGETNMRMRIGAFVGRNNKLIDNCQAGVMGTEDNPEGESVTVDINLTYTGNMTYSVRNDRIGGFVGEQQTKDASNCSSNTELKYYVTKGRYALIGGFVGYSDSTNMFVNNCRGEGKLYVNCFNNNGVLLLNTRVNPSQIGKFGGNINNNGGRTSTVECWYMQVNPDAGNTISFGPGDIYNIP